MDPADWQALRENFSTNQYYAANISLDNEVVQQVGIRSRGKGSRSGTKPGLKVDFNRYVRGQEFHGYKSIVLDNLTQDNTFLKEPLSYAAFEAMGIAAPQISYTRLTVNDEYWGLYTLVEDISKPFLEQRFGQDDGNLFSYEYTYDYRFTLQRRQPGPVRPGAVRAGDQRGLPRPRRSHRVHPHDQRPSGRRRSPRPWRPSWTWTASSPTWPWRTRWPRTTASWAPTA